MIDLDQLAPIPRHGAPMGYMVFYRKDVVALRKSTAMAVAQRCAEIAINTPRVWDLAAPDPQHRIASAIAAAFGLEPSP